MHKIGGYSIELNKRYVCVWKFNNEELNVSVSSGSALEYKTPWQNIKKEKKTTIIFRFALLISYICIRKLYVHVYRETR